LIIPKSATLHSNILSKPRNLLCLSSLRDTRVQSSPVPSVVLNFVGFETVAGNAAARTHLSAVRTDQHLALENVGRCWDAFLVHRFRPNWARSSCEPSPVMRIARLSRRRATQPRDSRREYHAAPTAPARCGRRSVQSMHFRAKQRRLCRSRATSMPKLANQFPPSLPNS